MATLHDTQSKTYAHFIGVGGAGMSALALVLCQRGIAVTGSDMKESRYTRALEKAGMNVCIGHEAGNVGNPDVVVVSTAIPESNPELQAARARGLDIWPRAQMLANLAGVQRTIAVAGTHGKTSTSSMIATMMRTMNLDPSFCVGGEVDGINSNAASGSGDYYIVEADESDGSFIYLNPAVAVVTNIEADHLDHYDSLAEIETIFVEFMNRLASDGTLVVCGDDARLVELAKATGKRMLTYGKDASCDVRYRIVGRDGIGTRFELSTDAGVLGETTISTPGEHMVSNGCAAIAVVIAEGLDAASALKALSSFSGVRRRFDLVGVSSNVTVVDDYGHHPTEVAATLQAAATLDFTRTIVCFQPHRYSRTQAFEAEFGRAFKSADLVVMMDVYSAGETPIPGVSGRNLVESILLNSPHAQVAYLPHRSDVVNYLSARVRPGDLVLTMGAGDVTALGPELVGKLEEAGA